jgi:hypothetical protein
MVYRRVGERYADACVIQRQSFGGGSVMVWGGITAHGRTPLVVVPRNLTGIRYRDEIVQPYVIPFIQALIRIWNNIPQTFFNNLVRSMRRRCQACVNANGGHTHY